MLALWFGLPLLALTGHSHILAQQEADAPALLRAAPLAALIGTVKVSGPPGWNGRYLTRGWFIGRTLPLNLALGGWHRVGREGGSEGYSRKNERLGVVCRRFSGGFDVCNLQSWKPGHEK